jgi:hypothetical protein
VSCDGQGLCEKISMIADAWDEHGAEASLSDAVPDPMPSHVIDFDILRFMLSVARPMATSLSQKIGVGG